MSMITCNLCLQVIISYPILWISDCCLHTGKWSGYKQEQECARICQVYVAILLPQFCCHLVEGSEWFLTWKSVTWLLHYLVFSLIFLWYLACREMQPGLQRSGCSSFLVKSSDTYESCNAFFILWLEMPGDKNIPRRGLAKNAENGTYLSKSSTGYLQLTYLVSMDSVSQLLLSFHQIIVNY